MNGLRNVPRHSFIENGSKQSVIDAWTSTVMHEILHALGFSQGIWERNFVNPVTGQKYDPTTYFYERGVNVTKFVSTNALARGRQFFNCPTLNGVELETSGGSGTAGSHLEQRIFMDSVMSGSQVDGARLHPVTLGILEDSGWYQTDYSMAGPNYWGNGEGCSFALQKCLLGSKYRPTTNFTKYFCYNLTVNQEISCSLDRTAVTLCRVSQWSGSLPVPYQYFSDPTRGGSSELPDYCPYFGPVTQGSCQDASNAPPTNYWGESFGSSSFCLPSTLEDESYSRYYATRGVACYSVSCGGGSVYSVTVGGDRQTCSYEGQILTFSGFRGTIQCPKWSEVCGR
eukprot:TRINITY_DN4597_c0_g5_i1.p1 TRINITY_DN4597_c0_g5~~TRINITY_DN4597_c0_g5_i1.p1  ORF type:complete len:341 (-),score=65.33 TRINITY_DN4597_c0_g5_i1:86-1108(-)